MSMTSHVQTVLETHLHTPLSRKSIRIIQGLLLNACKKICLQASGITEAWQNNTLASQYYSSMDLWEGTSSKTVLKIIRM